MFESVLIFVPRDTGLLDSVCNKASSYGNKNVKLLVPNSVNKSKEFDKIRSDYYLWHIDDYLTESSKNILKIILSDGLRKTVDITYADPSYAFVLGELIQGMDVTVKCRGTQLGYRAAFSPLGHPEISTKARIIEYLRSNPERSAKEITQGVFKDPRTEDYNNVRVTLCRLKKQNKVIKDKNKRLYSLNDDFE